MLETSDLYPFKAHAELFSYSKGSKIILFVTVFLKILLIFINYPTLYKMSPMSDCLYLPFKVCTDIIQISTKSSLEQQGNLNFISFDLKNHTL